MKPLEEINEYLTQAKVFFLSTLQGPSRNAAPSPFICCSRTGCTSESETSKRSTGRCSSTPR